MINDSLSKYYRINHSGKVDDITVSIMSTIILVYYRPARVHHDEYHHDVFAVAGLRHDRGLYVTMGDAVASGVERYGLAS